ncbi:MAG TPA: NADH-quinone oxidoreductase subunit E [Spirochaetaceae bacterium]|nr:NADH-quinone oxidoreductase subunit E [Spirochaetaceae bacterium]HAW86776.1 NADH-quinone oxidoreductase subunit E [Spirochaetaceae bacterium]HAX37002.1 NADH-quinone oxidoreductase subunit E [Spirochaetaceae bacterium]HBO41522.1 NADH-quinone oxidoreductase subunit E [Spirochaetaceae bacterium]HCQ87951.1 NADH-quinone oxidoreductase subunit E [Spirochaetaceae bacterium]
MNTHEILQKYGKDAENLLALLHELQNTHEQHYLSAENLAAAAAHMGLTEGYVYGVASFYTMFSLKPRGRHIVRVCQSPPCHLMGSTDVARELIKVLGVSFGETTADGQFSLEMSSCLGVCGVAPAMMVDDEVYGNLSASRVHEIIEDLRRVK